MMIMLSKDVNGQHRVLSDIRLYRRYYKTTNELIEGPTE